MSRKMLLETCLALAAAVVSVGGVGVLSATTPALDARAKCATVSPAAERPPESCSCGQRAAVSPIDDGVPTAVVGGPGCRSADVAEAHAPITDPRPAPEKDPNDARRIALLAGLLVGARIGLRRMRLFQSPTPGQ